MGHIGEKCFHLEYQMTDRHDGQIVYANGESVLVWFDYEKDRTVEVPEEMREKLKTYQKVE
ncbi:MAG: thioesterase family protein [Syntrophales bacterium]